MGYRRYPGLDAAGLSELLVKWGFPATMTSAELGQRLTGNAAGI